MPGHASPHGREPQHGANREARGAARKGPPPDVQPPARAAERYQAASLAQDDSTSAQERRNAAQKVRQFASDATDDEITELLGRYAPKARTLPGYVVNRNSLGKLLPDLKKVRSDLAEAAIPAASKLPGRDEECEHGTPGGLYALPSGEPTCPHCRKEGKAAIRSPAAASSGARSAGPEAGQGRRVKLIAASRIPPRPVRWGWQGRLAAGHVSLIAGREGIGKSLFLIWATALITRGELPGVFYGTPRPVFYSASEDSWAHTIVPRLIAAGADLGQVYRVAVEVQETATFVQMHLPRDCDLVATEIKNTGAAMVAIDPLMSVLDPNIDTHNDRELRTALEPLGKVADETGCMIVGIAHFNKSAGDDVLSLVTGSRAFTAVVRGVIAVARDPEMDDGTCVISQAKNNLGRLDIPNLTYVVESVKIDTPEGKAETARLRITGETDKSVRDILSDPATASDRTERSRCMEWLRETLADAENGEKRTREILDEAVNMHGFASRTVYRARRELGVKARQKPTGSKGGNEWWLSLPETGQTAPGTQAAT